ncbi:MAG: hypothetical protein R3F34_04600 [Planctomycetota bacterium]
MLAGLVALELCACGDRGAATSEVQGAAVERIEHETDGSPRVHYYEKRAPGSTTAIVLVHGMTWSSVPDFDLEVEGEERSFMDGLVERGVTAYAVDLRGYGRTSSDTPKRRRTSC